MAAGTNWAGNVTLEPGHFAEPRSLEELQEVVSQAAQVRVLGTAHSFNRIVATSGTLLSMRRMPSSIDIDSTGETVFLRGLVRYADLGPELAQHGLALHNLGSASDMSVVGACATGTHGAGRGNRCLASAVTRIDLVAADGELYSVVAGQPDFDGLVVGLGRHGVVVGVRLLLEPAYEVCQTVYEGLRWKTLVGDVAEILSSAYSVSVFTRYDDNSSVWAKRRADEETRDLDWTGAVRAASPRQPVPGLHDVKGVFTDQSGASGPWHERLPHFRRGYPPAAGQELQSEFFVPLAAAGEALRAVNALRQSIRPLLIVSEIRAVARDEHWLCPAYGRDTAALHFTWVRDEPAVLSVVGAIERALLPWGARPHWGKLSTMDRDRLRPLYPRWEDADRLAAAWDPDGIFRNELLSRWFESLCT